MSFLKKSVLFAAASALVLSGFINGTASATPVSFDDSIAGVVSTTIENELNVINKEAKAAIYALALTRCVAAGVRNGDSGTLGDISNNGADWSVLMKPSGDTSMFDNSSNAVVPVGDWLDDSDVDNNLAGLLEDGDATCLGVDWIGKFLDVVDGSSLGLSRNSFLCGLDGNGGIVTIVSSSSTLPGANQCGLDSTARYSRNGNPGCLWDGDDYNTNTLCSESEWPIERWATSSPNAGLKWLYAIKDVYDTAVDHYGWSTHFFDMINGMSSGGWYLNVADYIKYYVLREEVIDRCGSIGTSVGINSNLSVRNTTSLANVTPVPHNSLERYDTIGSLRTLTFTEPTHTVHTFDRRMDGTGAQCQNVIGRINMIYRKYLDHMKERLNTNCGTAINAFASQYDLAPSSQQKVRMANASTSVYSNGYFIESVDGDENNGWQCLTGIVNAEGEELIVDPDDIDDGIIDDLTPMAGSEADCYTSAGSLGWILCPVINNGQGAVEWLYGLIQGFMKVNTNLFTIDNTVKDADGNTIQTNGVNGTYSAWSTFRDLANIAFIAVFLAVILSQLTGFGIDNYGIKKILPKLIVTAILINVSYIICQLAIDVANIVGGGIENLFSGLQANMIGKVGIQLPGDTGNHIVQSFAAGGVVLAIVGGICAAGFLAASGSVLVPVLIALVSILISIITFLVILAVRQGMAVLLVVISPLAFLAYALPNTKPLFKKWYKALGALLLAYPICSGLIYGGEMISTILLISNRTSSGNVTNFAVALSAAAVSIAPIFLIPTVIRGSMGKISGGISKLGRSGRGLAGKRVRSSNFASDLNRRAALGKAGLRFDKDGKPIYNWRGRLQNALPQTEANKRRLQGLRESAINENAANIAAGEKFGDLEHLNDIAEGKMAAIKKESYERQLERTDLKGAEAMLQNSVKDGKIDMYALEAAASKIGGIDQGRLLEGLSAITDTKEFKNMSYKDKNRFLSMLNSQDNLVLKAYAKDLGKRGPNDIQSISGAKGEIMKNIADNKDNNLATTADKDVLGWMADKGYADAFNSSQIKAMMTSNMGGTQAENAAEILRKRSADKLMEDLNGLTEDQVGNAKDLFIKAASENAGVGEAGVREAIGKKVESIYFGNNEQLKSKLTQAKKDFVDSATIAARDAAAAAAEQANRNRDTDTGRRYPPSTFDGGNA